MAMGTEGTATVTVCRLADNKLSVRVDGKEVVLLPAKLDCSMEDLAEAFQAVVDTVVDNDVDTDW